MSEKIIKLEQEWLMTFPWFYRFVAKYICLPIIKEVITKKFQSIDTITYNHTIED